MDGARGPGLPAVPTLPVQGWLTGPRIDLLFLLALLPPLGQSLYGGGLALLPILVLSLGLAIGWQAIFTVVRGRAFSFSSISVAIAFALLLPTEASLWQIALGLTFGVVVGMHLFGGYGWNFLNPVAVALVFLVFSFTEAGYGSAPPVAWESCVPGAILLVATGVISWRILAAAAATLTVTLYLLPASAIDPVAALGGFAFVLVFLACDPVATPATDPGRWIYAVIVGLLAALGLASGKPQMEVFASAVLLGGIFSPLIDQGMTRTLAWQRRRRRRARHG